MTSREIRDLTLLGIAVLAVEAGSLEVHRVHVCASAATFDGLFLGRLQQSRAETSPAMIALDPQQFDVKPSPEGLTQEAAEESAVIASGNDCQGLVAVARHMESVECAQATCDGLAVSRGGICADVDAQGSPRNAHR